MRRPFKPLEIVYIKRPEDGRIVETAIERVYSIRLGQGTYAHAKLLGVEATVPVEYLARSWKQARHGKHPFPGAEGLPTITRDQAKHR